LLQTEAVPTAYNTMILCRFCIQNTESGFPAPLTTIFHVFPGLFNWVDNEQVRFSYI